MPLPEELDALTAEELFIRSSGEKWSRHPDCIGASVAEMDFGTAPEVTEALQEALESHAFGYVPIQLSAELAEACGEMYNDHWGWMPTIEWIHPIADVIKAAEVAITMLSPAGSKVILPTPTYMPFVELPRLLGREAIEAPMARGERRWELDLEAMEAAFSDGGHTVILCNPANPTGRVFERSELEALAELVERRGGRVFADEIHAPLTYPGHSHVPYASLSEATAAHTVTAISASKAWNVPGLKCAQILFSNRDDAATWERQRGFAAYGTSILGVIANTAAYREGRMWLQEILDYLATNRATVAELTGDLMPGVDHLMPEGTYLAWLDLRGTAIADRAQSAGGLAEALRRETGVSVTDGADCGRAGRGFIRFNFATPAPILEEALRRISAVL